MTALLEKLFAFLEKNLPWFLLGLKMGRANDKDLLKENATLRLEVKAGQNEKEIRSHNATLSDDELKSEIISGGPGKITK